MRRRLLVVSQSISGQRQAIDRADHIVRKQSRILVVRVLLADLEFDGLGDPRRKIGTSPVRELQVFTIALRIEFGVVLLDETACAANEVQAHKVTPVVRVFALLKGGERSHRALMTANEFRLAQFAQEFFRADSDVLLFVDEQAKLIREIEVGLVVGRSRQQNDATVVRRDILGDGAIAAALAIPQVVALVDQNQAESAEAGKFPLNLGDREDLCPQPIFLAVILPHADQVLRADDKRLDPVIVLKDARQRGCHERLAQPDHVADDHAAAFVQMVRRDFNGRLLKLEEFVAEIAGDAKLRQAGASLLGEVVGHLDVDVVRRDRLGTRPTVVDDLDKFFRNIDAKPIIPAVLKPLGQFVASVVVQDIDIEFTLL